MGTHEYEDKDTENAGLEIRSRWRAVTYRTPCQEPWSVRRILIVNGSAMITFVHVARTGVDRILDEDVENRVRPELRGLSGHCISSKSWISPLRPRATSLKHEHQSSSQDNVARDGKTVCYRHEPLRVCTRQIITCL